MSNDNEKYVFIRVRFTCLLKTAPIFRASGNTGVLRDYKEVTSMFKT